MAAALEAWALASAAPALAAAAAALAAAALMVAFSVTVSPSSSLAPPKLVSLEMWPNSWLRAANSACSAPRSALVAEPSAAWMARSCIRVRILVVSPSAPSPVCSSDRDFCRLAMAATMPCDWEDRRVAICNPAASSMAELMRRPVPSRVMASSILPALRPSDICAVRAAELVCRLNMGRSGSGLRS